MRVLILGVGDAFTRLHFGSSALIEAPGGHVLLDCPDAIHRCLHEATSRAGWSADASSIDDILLTHLHGDHCNGLESFGFARRILSQGAGPGAGRPRIHTSRAAADRLWERLAPAMDAATTASPRSLDDYYEIHELEPGTRATVAGLTVECRFTQHPVPTLGLLISDGAGTLGWSSDTPFDEAHLQWLSRADVIVHECNRPPMHTPIESFMALPPELTAKIRLNHLPDDFDPSSTAMSPLREGEVLVLG
ncbi:MAG: MBL fold metallo-hydrolase [Planctomycetota bacterium]|jgi:ribonuclease BN (tRNA processing enzyme)